MQMIKNLFYQPMDKMTLYYHFFRTLYNNASKVILLEGLPDDADYHFILSQLLLVGKIQVFKANGKVYLLNGNVGGKCDEYYYPTRVLVANPILGSFDLERGKEAVPVYLTPADRILDSPLRTNVLPGGMYSLISMCANVLSECITTINTTLMNTRVHAIYTADSDSAAKSAEPILKAIYMGKPYSVVTSELLERLNVNPLSEHGLATTLTETVEVCQYILAMFWNGLGVDMPFNMKRERLVTAEVDKNLQSLIVPVQTILETLNEGFEKANSLFGTELKALLNPDFNVEASSESSSESAENSAPVQESEGTNDNTKSNDNTESNPDNSKSGFSQEKSSGDNTSEIHDSNRPISDNREDSNTEPSGTESSETESSDNESRSGDNASDENTRGEEGNNDGEVQNNITINIISGSNNDVTIEPESESLEDSDGESESKEDTSDAPVQNSQSDDSSDSDDSSTSKDKGDDDE